MSAEPQNESTVWIQRSRKSWIALSQGAVWIVSIIGGFLLPPAIGISESTDKVWVRLGQFTITAVLGILFIAARKWNNPRHATRWWIGSAVLLIASLAAVVAYQALSYEWTCNYYKEVKIIGGQQYTQHGLEYIRENPQASCETILKEHVGKVYDVWTKESIDHRRITLAVIYITCIPLFTTCIVAVTQAVQLAAQ